MIKTCVPNREMAPLMFLNCMRIRHRGLFFEVTDKTVAVLGDIIQYMTGLIEERA